MCIRDREQNSEKYNVLLHKIHHEINLRKQQKHNGRIMVFKNAAKWLSRAAAILFIPLLGVVFYLLFNNTIQMKEFADLTVDSLEVIAPIGSRTVVQLSDGTEIHLNYGSKIKYPRNFIGDTRGITLSGEGYFNVAHNPEKPFVVKTGILDVKALGTEFNVHAYPGDEAISTTLVKGKVVIEKTDADQITMVGAMVPGQHVEYDIKSGKITSAKGATEKYTAWREGRMIFDNTPILEVARELSRKFNVDIVVAPEIYDLTYTVTFADDPLYLILDLMTETTPVSYKRFPREKLADGSFSKQKIRIEKRK
jgi:ferric-dicitrate binding protein FerR (iron transport regulator)